MGPHDFYRALFPRGTRVSATRFGAFGGAGATPPSPLSDARWMALAAALLLAMFASTFPQYAIGVLAPIFTAELGIGEAVVGYAAGSMYVAAAVVARFAARSFDKIGGRAALIILGGSAVASLLALAGIRSTPLLLLACGLAGIGMGTNNPITNRLISLHVHAGRRGVVIGVKQTGVKVAQLASGALLPALAITVGWRTGLVGIAVVTAAILSAGLVFVPSEKLTGGVPAPTTSFGAARRSLRWLQGYSALMAIGMSGVTTYLPLYAVNRLGFSLVRAGLVVTLFAATATITRIMWAVLAERRREPAGILCIQAVGGVLALSILGTAEHLGEPALWGAAALGGATVGSWNVVAQLTVVTEIEAAHSAAVTGAVQSAFLLGLAMGAPLVGLLIQTTASFQLAWGATAALAAVAAVTASRHGREAHLEGHATAD